MKLICQNTNGITPKLKQLPAVDITILTETHRKTVEKSKILQHLSQSHTYQSDGERNSKGVTIIVKDEIPHKIEKISNTGNYIIMSFEANAETYNLVGLYLEPEDYATNRLKNVVQEITSHINGKENLIILGDFNCIAERKDAKVNTIQTTNLLKKYDQLIKPLKNRFDLTDVWCEHNPNGTKYTHISSTNATRLDQALCNKLNANAYKIQYKILGNFDHKGIQLVITDRQIWRKGLWKLNTKLIEND